LSYKPYKITCHRNMTVAAFRNELTKAKDRTAIIEEGDLYPSRPQLEGFLINRVDRKRTASIPVNERHMSKAGVEVWKTSKLHVPGATILHDRHEFTDLAADRRAITVHIQHKREKTFIKPDEKLLKSLSLPAFDYGTIPDIFDAPETTGSALDAWEPLIRVANSLGDDDWLAWAWDEVVEMGDTLADGQQYELELVAFKGIIKGYNDNNGMLMVKEPLSLSQVTSFVKKEYDPYIHPKTIATKLRRIGLKNIRNVGGDTKIFTTLDELKKIAKELDYQDDQLRV
ncbi:hypothetical protein ACFLWZ_07875, partial [Chloroflexota bacterium]